MLFQALCLFHSLRASHGFALRPNSKGGYETVKKINWTKISKIALGLKFKGELRHYSSSRVASRKSETVKKTCSLQGNIRTRFSAVTFIWLASKSDQILQQLDSICFCVKSVIGEMGTTDVPKPITIL